MKTNRRELDRGSLRGRGGSLGRGSLLGGKPGQQLLDSGGISGDRLTLELRENKVAVVLGPSRTILREALMRHRLEAKTRDLLQGSPGQNLVGVLGWILPAGENRTVGLRSKRRPA